MLGVFTEVEQLALTRIGLGADRVLMRRMSSGARAAPIARGRLAADCDACVENSVALFRRFSDKVLACLPCAWPLRFLPRGRPRTCWLAGHDVARKDPEPAGAGHEVGEDPLARRTGAPPRCVASHKLAAIVSDYMADTP